jgi:hypothetical protein
MAYAYKQCRWLEALLAPGVEEEMEDAGSAATEAEVAEATQQHHLQSQRRAEEQRRVEQQGERWRQTA